MNLAKLTEAADLLQLAERNATTEWEGASRPEEDTRYQAAELGSKAGQQAFSSVAPKATSEEGEVSGLDRDPDLFNLFQSQQVSLTAESRLVCLTDVSSPAAEAFRLLAVRLRHLRKGRPIQKVLITSTVPEEGKSMVAANVACALALRPEQRVLLVEGDVRRPALSRMFGFGARTGLCEWLRGDSGLAMSIYHLEGAGLWILPAGNVPDNPLKLVQSGRLPELMERLGASFDWVIIDSPPILPLADTSIWTQLADGILVVTRQGFTKKKPLENGLEALDPKKVIGAVLNGSTSPTEGYYYYRPSDPEQHTSG